MRAALVAVSVVTVAAVTGCAAGFNAETNNIDSPGEGISGSVGDVKIRGALLAGVDEEGVSGVLVMGVVNDGSESTRSPKSVATASRPTWAAASLSPTSSCSSGRTRVSPGAVYGGNTCSTDRPTDWWPATSSRCHSRSARGVGDTRLLVLLRPESSRRPPPRVAVAGSGFELVAEPAHRHQVPRRRRIRPTPSISAA